MSCRARRERRRAESQRVHRDTVGYQAARARLSSRVPNEFAADSALEGTGFEPSVPREAPGILVVSVLVRADFFSRPGNQAEVT